MAQSAVEARLRMARVARLATCDAEGRPHVIPVCFVYHRELLYTALDRKPKRFALEKLTRVRNIETNPEVALLLDEYDEDWQKLWYVLVRGRASILRDGAEQQEVVVQLRNKYPQYASLRLLPAGAPVIRVVPVKISSWSGVVGTG
jgi:PPOX class probable F420-dependent enzyme